MKMEIIRTYNIYLKYYLYIKNLKYPHLTPVFQIHNVHFLYKLPDHTNLNGYCVPKTGFKRSFERFFDINNYQICLKNTQNA